MAQGDNMNTEKIIKTCLIDTRIAELKALLSIVEQQHPHDIVGVIEDRIKIFEQIKAMDDDTNS